MEIEVDGWGTWHKWERKVYRVLVGKTTQKTKV
jgi:hypothetical protein